MRNFKRKMALAAITAASWGKIAAAHAASITIPNHQMPSLETPPDASELTNFFGSFKVIGTAVSGICAITALIFFIISIAKLSTSAGNDMQRSRAMKQILYAGLALALFGSITVVVSIFWNAL